MTGYKFGEIVLIEFPSVSGEERKRRPAMVVLDIGDDDLLLAPITSVARNSSGDQSIPDPRQAGLLLQSWVRLAKMNCLNKAGIQRKLGAVSDEFAGQCRAELRRLLA